MTVVNVIRYSQSSESTLGLLLINWLFYCHTLEDAVRNAKIAGITAIPSGVYNLSLRYSQRFGRRLIAVDNVPNYTGILFHPGNISENTEGCILVGQKANNNRHEKGRIFNSQKAHTEFFDLIAAAIEQGEEVKLVIGDPVELFKYENLKEVA